MSHFSKTSKNIPMGKALLIILISMMCSGSFAAGGFFFIKNIKNKHLNDKRFNITAIVQKCTKGQYLKTGYFAEYLDFSLDRPTNLYQLDLNDVKKKLLASPLIQEIKLKKNLPNILYIEYETRIPMAFLDDFTNTAIDKNGFLFPFKPFFTPKKLPKIFIGLSEFGSSCQVCKESVKWGETLKGFRVDIAFKIYRLLMQYYNITTTEVIKIDVSKAFALSYGEREIVVVLEDQILKNTENGNIKVHYPRMLRLSTDRYSQELANYFTLRNTLLKVTNENNLNDRYKDQLVIDLRIPNLAFFTHK